MNPARDTADRIGLEVERDAALAEVVRLRGIIAEVKADAEDAILDLDKGHGEYSQGMNDQAARTLAILAWPAHVG